MTLNNILKYISISLLLVLVFASSVKGQESNINIENKTESVDTIQYKYGVRFGIDISGPISGIFKSNEKLYKGAIDARVYKNYFAALEFGLSEKHFTDVNLEYTTKGVFTTLGFDYNFLGYTEGRNDVMSFGIRYGFANYDTEVLSYKIQNGYWLNQAYESSIPSQNGYAHWINARISLKVEVLKNLYLGASMGFNKLFKATQLDSFNNLFIPGFGNNNDSKAFQFNYTLLYLLPFN